MISRLLFIALFSLFLAACNRAQQTDKARSAAPDAAATSKRPVSRPAEPVGGPPGLDRPELALPKRDTAPVDAKVVNVRLSNSGDTERHTLGAPVQNFAPTDTIYAEVETSGSASEYTIYAKWMTADGTVLADYGMRVGQPGTKRTVISLSKPDGWPKGRHSIELAVNGKTERTVTFDVP